MAQRVVPVFALVLAGCAEDASMAVRWEPLDVAAFEARFAAPSGTLTPITVATVSSEVTRIDLRLANGLWALVDRVRTAGTDGATGSLEAALETEDVPVELLPGAQAFARVSCPGPDEANPDVEFGHGQVHIDSGEGLESFELRGQLLLRFEACDLTTGLLAGTSRAYYEPEGERFMIELRADARVDGIDRFLSRDVIRSDGQVWALLTPEPGETFVVSFDPATENEFTVKAKNGTFDCATENGQGVCTGATGTFTFEAGS